jgi:hypothetical protein
MDLEEEHLQVLNPAISFVSTLGRIIGRCHGRQGTGAAGFRHVYAEKKIVFAKFRVEHKADSFQFLVTLKHQVC